MCAVPAQQSPGRPRITPIQWIGLAVLLLLLLNQMGLLRIGPGGLSLSSLTARLPRLVALVLAITVHEFSHGLVATLFGDTVPRRAGRLTLNPLKHLDPLGTLLILIGPIGWGRPMPINPAGMRNPNLGWALSSFAGPLSNVLVALVATVALALVGPMLDATSARYFQAFISINVLLAVFNLFPLPPLDGFGFLFGLAPRNLKLALVPLHTYGPLILLGLLFLPALMPGFPPILETFINVGSNLVTDLLVRVYDAI